MMHNSISFITNVIALDIHLLEIRFHLHVLDAKYICNQQHQRQLIPSEYRARYLVEYRPTTLYGEVQDTSALRSSYTATAPTAHCHSSEADYV